MLNSIATHKKLLFTLFFILLNLVSVFFISLVFLGASNANGEGAPIQTELVGFGRMFIYAFTVSIIASFLAVLLTRIFTQASSFSKTLIRNIFWFELIILLFVFLSIFFYVYFLRSHLL
jgi:hypothetical protein